LSPPLPPLAIDAAEGGPEALSADDGDSTVMAAIGGGVAAAVALVMTGILFYLWLKRRRAEQLRDLQNVVLRSNKNLAV